MPQSFRIGHGFDVHAFAAERPLILGGVVIPAERGLSGHSDADVLLHAFIDALLGALCLGDIGTWFPDTEAAYKGADSSVLFERVWKRVREEGWSLVNADSVVMAQRPKLGPHMTEIRSRLSELFAVGMDQVSVKATTTERLGFLGREEGIAASATVLLSK